MPSETINQSLPGMGVTTHRLPGSPSGVYGPQTSQAGVYPWRSFKRSRTWSRQPKPYEHTLPYDDVVTTSEAGYFDYEIVNYPNGINKPPDRTRYFGNGGSHSDTSWVEDHVLASTTDAKNKVLGALQDAKWNAALFAAEANKTADLIWQTAKRLAGAYRAVRTKRYDRALELLSLRSPSGPRSEWLAYRYGWTPLLSDVMSAAEAAASTLVDRPPSLKVVKRGAPYAGTSDYFPAYWPARFVCAHSGESTDLQYRVVRHERRETKAWLEVEASNSTYMRLEQFGLANPAALAWELIPFSFVADWFVGIGDYLNSQTALLGLRVVDGGYSQLSIRTSHGSVLGIRKGAYNQSINGWLPRASLTSRKYVRGLWDGSPPPIRIEAELNWKRILDGAALVTAVWPRGSK